MFGVLLIQTVGEQPQPTSRIPSVTSRTISAIRVLWRISIYVAIGRVHRRCTARIVLALASITSPTTMLSRTPTGSSATSLSFPYPERCSKFVFRSRSDPNTGSQYVYFVQRLVWDYRHEFVNELIAGVLDWIELAS